MAKIYAIVADKLLDTGMVSFKFMFSSGAPYLDFRDIANRYGLLVLTPKPDDFVDLFKIGRPELRVEADEAVLRWNLFVFKSGHGQVLSGGVDWDEKHTGLAGLIGEASDFVLLTHIEALEGLEAACKELGTELTVFRYEGTLSTS